MRSISKLFGFVFLALGVSVSAMADDGLRHYTAENTDIKKNICFEKESDTRCNGVVHAVGEDGSTREWYVRDGALYQFRAYTRDKRLFREEVIADPASKTVTEYYDDGEKQVVYYQNNEQVKWEWYYSNGNKKFSNNYKEGFPEGEWINFQENGTVSTKEVYSNNAKDYVVSHYFFDGSLRYTKNVTNELTTREIYYYHCNNVEKTLVNDCRIAPTATLKHTAFWDGFGFVEKRITYNEDNTLDINDKARRVKVEYDFNGDKKMEVVQEREVHDNEPVGGIGILWRDVTIIFEASPF
ncbi:toxin-antitoxin system YwqK family antitoxin [Enterovibrio baiacu]|uniref:toxin-antitoxin system YwqK family antitoxin n=1 Tax=Enterovibrio baiacu TaxID=2491023 RepID=UPI001010584B|nr:hypothetical protein [Enterovibrio baiacu]MBE1273881.1 hypothetical protein [Enterovibrio baiacu]